MTRLRYHPPAAAPPPAAPAPATLQTAFDALVQLALIGVCIVGFLAVMRWLDGVLHPLPPPGWTCWSVTRSTAAGSQHDRRCEPAEGWHLEDWPGVGKVAVPDDARVMRRYPVRDRF